MDYGIKLVAIQGQEIDPPQWLVDFQPDLHQPGDLYPTGYVETDIDVARAKRFGGAGDAFSFLRTQSTVCPLRPDGKPNRPLLAFTTEIMRLPDLT